MGSRQEHNTTAGPFPSPPACPIQFSSLRYDSSKKRKAPKSRTFDVESVAATGVLTQKDQDALHNATRAMLARQNKNLRATNPRKDEADRKPKHDIPPPAGKTALSKTILPPRTDDGIQAPGLTVAYPNDKHLELEDIRRWTQIPETPKLASLRADHISVCTKEVIELVSDPRLLGRHHSNNRTFEWFHLNGYLWIKITYHDVDSYERISNFGIRNCMANRAVEQAIDEHIPPQPDFIVEKMLMAEMWVEVDGFLGSSLDAQASELQEKARRRLKYEPGLLQRIKDEIARKLPMTLAKREMYKNVDNTFKATSVNKFHQDTCYRFAVENHFFDYIYDFDFCVTVDRYKRPLLYQDMHAISRYFGVQVLQKLGDGFRKYTQLIPSHAYTSDSTRHREQHLMFETNPEFDPEASDADARKANCGVSHYGVAGQTGKPNSGVGEQDQKLTRSNSFTTKMFDRIQYGYMGAGTEILNFVFSAIDPVQHAQYREIFQACPKDKRMETRDNDTDVFTLVAVLNNLLSSGHIDESDIKDGMAGILGFGDHEEAEFVAPTLGLQLATKTGCVQLFRGAKIYHFICKWTGKDRGAFVYATGSTVQNWTHKNILNKDKSKPPSVEHDDNARETHRSSFLEKLNEAGMDATHFWLD